MRACMIVLAFVATTALAHPPVSVAIDTRGNIYYSDLVHVWQLAPDGTKRIAVPNVHTHELYLDAQGNLFGENQHYEDGKWSHSVWRRAADGRVTQVLPERAGFLTDYSFVRDANGTMYFANEGRTEVRKRTSAGRITTLARGFREIRWMHATPRGTVYLVDSGTVFRVTPDGRITALARNLGAARHALMGLWTDAAENVYVADHANRQVKRITPRGEVTTTARASAPWSVAGGAFDARGRLVLLEVSDKNEVRVRFAAR